MSVVLELLRGADLESTSRKCGVSAATLSEWRDALLAAGEEGLKIRQEDLVDEPGRRVKSVIAELAVENELLERAHPAQQVREAFSAVGVEAMSGARLASAGRVYGRLSGAKGVGLAEVDVLPPAPPAGLSAFARAARPEDALHG